MSRSKIRYFIGYIISVYLILTGKVSKVINQSMKGDIILSIYFHNPTKKTFVSLINWLQKNGFHFITADELIRIIKKDIQFPKGAVFLSIDDGWRENLENVFTVTSNKKIPILFFATMEPIINNSGFWWSYIEKGITNGVCVENKNILKMVSNTKRLEKVDKIKSIICIDKESIDIDNLKILANENTISIGSHTYSHPIMTKCNEKELAFEVGMSKTMIEKNINKKVKYFAYPNGIHRKREVKSLIDNKYVAAFGTDPEYIIKNRVVNVYDIPRFEISDHVSLKENICRMTGVWYSLNITKKDNA